MTKLLVYKKKRSVGKVAKTPVNQSPITYSTVEFSMCLKEQLPDPKEIIRPQSTPIPQPDNAAQSESAKPDSEMESTLINCPSDASLSAVAT